MSKINQIIDGWKNYLWESPQIELLAVERAQECGKCDHAKHGTIIDFLSDEVKEIQGMYCDLCDCPFSTLLRSPESECKEKKWLLKTF